MYMAKNAVFWGDTVWLLLDPTFRRKVSIPSSGWKVVFCVFQLLVTADVVPSSLILSILMMGAIRSSETSVLTRFTRCHIPEDGILHSLRSEGLKSYIALTAGLCSGDIMCFL
jgi:hypothetical protein